MADLGQGKDVNRRTLDRLKSINEREIRRAKAAAKRQGISWEEYVGEAPEAPKEKPQEKSSGIKFLGFD
jgi:hypothetical protein